MGGVIVTWANAPPEFASIVMPPPSTGAAAMPLTSSTVSKVTAPVRSPTSGYRMLSAL